MTRARLCDVPAGILNINGRLFRRSCWWGGPLFALAQGDDRCRASRPSGQILQNGDEFNHKGGQEQKVKTDDPTDQNHRCTINDLIAENPACRAEQQLQSIRKHGHRERKDDSRACQLWRAKHPIQPVC